MSDLQLTVAVLAILAAVALWFSWDRLARARLIEDTPTSKIRSAPQGFVELIGSTKADQPLLRAPLSSKPCLWYDVLVERWQKSGKSYSWHKVRSERSDFSFYIDDGTGRCHVHPDGADVTPVHRDIWFADGPDAYFPTGTRAGSSLFLTGQKYRYRERRIHENDLLYAIGLFQTVYPKPQSVLVEDQMVELLAEWKSHQLSLLQRFDADGDGQISETEWQEARREAASQAHAYVLENYDHEPAHMLSRPPGRSQHYILASSDPRTLARSYRISGWFAAICFVGVLVLMGSILVQG